MPNPAELTVPVPEGVGYYKMEAALKAALLNPHLESKVVDATLYIDIEPLGERIYLNPNVLDPEDAVLCARVLGAIITRNEGPPEISCNMPVGLACWVGGGLMWCNEDASIKWGPYPSNLKGWRIHSIPALGLTRE